VAALGERTGGTLSGPADAEVVAAVRQALAGARLAYGALEFREVIRLVSQAASVCNRRVQEAKPWEAPASPAAQALLASVGQALVGLAVALHPVMPRFTAALAAAFGAPSLPAWAERFDPFDGRPVRLAGKPPQIARLEARHVAKLIAAPSESAGSTPATVAAGAGPAPAAVKASGPPAAPAAFGVIQYDDFAKVELRVGAVRSAAAVPKADKLLQLSVDVGEPAPRTIVAGIAQAYPDPSVLVGKRIVVVANLAPRPLRGITSQGMLLAAGEPPLLQVVTVGEAIAPGTRVK
jgi:methionyl-tRNA synthetase